MNQNDLSLRKQHGLKKSKNRFFYFLKEIRQLADQSALLSLTRAQVCYGGAPAALAEDYIFAP